MSTEDVVIPNFLQQLSKSTVVLTKLVNQVRHNEQLVIQIRELLPTALGSNVSSVLLQDDRLVLWVTSPVWKSRLRYVLPTLSKKFPHIKNIRVAILPPIYDHCPATKQSLPIRTLSAAHSYQLQDLAKQTFHPRLQAVLMKLAAHSNDSI